MSYGVASTGRIRATCNRYLLPDTPPFKIKTVSKIALPLLLSHHLHHVLPQDDDVHEHKRDSQSPLQAVLRHVGLDASADKAATMSIPENTSTRFQRIERPAASIPSKYFTSPLMLVRAMVMRLVPVPRCGRTVGLTVGEKPITQNSRLLSD